MIPTSTQALGYAMVQGAFCPISVLRQKACQEGYQNYSGLRLFGQNRAVAPGMLHMTRGILLKRVSPCPACRAWHRVKRCLLRRRRQRPVLVLALAPALPGPRPLPRRRLLQHNEHNDDSDLRCMLFLRPFPVTLLTHLLLLLKLVRESSGAPDTELPME